MFFLYIFFYNHNDTIDLIFFQRCISLDFLKFELHVDFPELFSSIEEINTHIGVFFYVFLFSTFLLSKYAYSHG